jgi:hypothetical protein
VRGFFYDFEHSLVIKLGGRLYSQLCQLRKEAAEEDYLRTLGISLLWCWKLEKELVRRLRETIEVRMSGDAERSSDPSPVPLRLVKAPVAGHPLPEGEGKDRIPYDL